MKTQTAFLLCFFSAIVVFSQSASLGGAIGYGGYDVDNNPNFIQLIDKNAGKHFVASLLVSYKPEKPIFAINSGLTYQSLFSDQRTISFLKVPLGLEFQLGKTCQFLFGAGFYGQALLSGINNFYDDYTKFQLGFYIDLGFGYTINDKYALFIKVQKNNDFTRLYIERAISHIGDVYYDNYYLYSYAINIGFKYRITTKNSGQ